MAVTVTVPDFSILEDNDLSIYVDEAKTFTFTFASTHDFAGDTLRFVVHDRDGSVSFSLNSGITIATNVVTVAVPSANTATANTKLEYKLWDITTEQVLASGGFAIKMADVGT